MKKISKLWQKRHVKYQEIWDLEIDAKSLKQQVDQEDHISEHCGKIRISPKLGWANFKNILIAHLAVNVK